MKNKRKLCLTVFTFAMLCWNASFAQVTVIGARSCGEWIRSQQEGNGKSIGRLASEAWLLGFLSGMAIAERSNVLKGMGSSAMVWMDNYCRANPLDGIDDGGIKLFDELVARKGK